MTRQATAKPVRSEGTRHAKATRKGTLGTVSGRSELERTLFSRLGKLLRLGTELRTSVDFAIAVSQGLGVVAAETLVEERLIERKELDSLVPRRTLAHRREQGQRLKRDESDMLARVAKVVTLAHQVFGETERARRWLRSPKKAFKGRTPFEMLASSEGAQLVEESLIRVDEGYFA